MALTNPRMTGSPLFRKRFYGREFLRQLFNADEYCWITGHIQTDMRCMDTDRIEAIRGWIENRDRRDCKLVCTKQYSWILHELNQSWGWMRLVRRRRDCYETRDILTDSMESNSLDFK